MVQSKQKNEAYRMAISIPGHQEFRNAELTRPPQGRRENSNKVQTSAYAKKFS